MSSKRFRVAFSFAGEKRDFVAQVAAILANRFGEAAILYDKYHEAEFARRDLGIYLPELYHKESDLVVVVVCPDYDEKEWTGLEWAAIHDLLKLRKDAEVMLCRFEHATVTGLYSTAGYVELDDKTPEQAATLILQRLAFNESKLNNHYVADANSSSLFVERKAPTSIKTSRAMKKWQEKLDFLLEELATTSNPAQKFEIKSQIEEAKAKIAELGG